MLTAKRRPALLLLLLPLVFAVACGGSSTPAVSPTDTQQVSDEGSGSELTGGSDTVSEDGATTQPDGGGACEAGAPAGHATIRFWVDDRARRTFDDGEMVWTGSFALDEDTNVVAYSSAWLPTDGPFPLLYDDGPRADCGHEVPDAAAGDHVFTSEVYFLADEETVIEYGLLNEWNNWMWSGANGVLTIPAQSTDIFDAGGMEIPPCGLADFKVALDLNALHEDFAGSVTPDSHDVYVKGSMNQWTDVYLVDNGKRGDEVADDGIYTFQLSENFGKHDCHLLAGEHAQFVFSFAFPEQEPTLEYKAVLDGSETALADGVTAWVDPLGDGTWQEAEVFHELASDGRKRNTAAAVPGEEASCETDDDCTGDKAYCIVGFCVTCYEDDHCGDGTCVANYCQGGGSAPECTSDDQCDGLTVCVAEHCVECRDATSCQDGEICRNYRCQEEGTGCASDGDCPGGVCVETVCVECRIDGDCPEGERCSANRCVPRQSTGEGPLLYQILPNSGPVTGNTTVVLKGIRFAAGIEVAFAGADASDIVVDSDTQLTCVTPAGSIGYADVLLRDPTSGDTDTFYGGFYYYDQADGPSITAVEPASGSMAGGTNVDIWGSNFDAGVQVRFGSSVAAVTFVDGGHLSVATPAGAAGAVDVTATNPSGLSDTCAGCFTYEPESVDWAGLQEPFEVQAFEDADTPALYASVYEGGVTPGEGAGAGLTAQVGFGPDGSDPAAEDSPWQWQPAAFHADLANEWGDLNNDIYTGTLSVDTAGLYDFAFRFSVDGGESWFYADRDYDANPYDISAAGSLLVDALPTGPMITALTPRSGNVAGGTSVTIDGINFDAAATVDFGGQAATVTTATETRLVVTTPAHDEGLVDVTVSNPDDESHTLLGAFYYGQVTSPTMDGEILEDWPAATLLAQNDIATDWGSDNVLEALYVAYDETALYVGIVGEVSTENTIVGYVDPELSAGTGIDGSGGCWDGDGVVDDALCVSSTEENAIAFAAAGFAPTVGFGIHGLASYNDPGCASLGDSAEAGWRRVGGTAVEGDDLHWLCGQVLRYDHEGASDHFELSIPLDVLYGGAAPSGGATVGIAVRLVNAHGDYSSNQSLPPFASADPGAARYELSSVVEIEIR